MKVICETYRRNRNNSSSSIKNGAINNNNNNNNNAKNNSHPPIEICHPNDLFNSNHNNHNQNNDQSNHESNAINDYRGGGDQNHLARTTSSSLSTTYRHIISMESLVINKELGIGEFGVVQQGVWTNQEGHRIQVAIKCLSPSRVENNRIEFLKEATIMHSISHESIVTLYGVVLEPSLMLITELAPLRSLLECLKEPALISHFPLTSLCSFASQIADGMAYLESKRLIHRDLAARNILVFSKCKVKISDFGLSRALGVGKDYYQSNFNVNLKLPIAWCAPECINYLKFTSQSDVWAYGVTLWEMFSFGFQPWAALTGQQILEAIDKPNYQRLEKPDCCPKEYYQLMLKCWTHEPNLRPKFSEIVQLLPDCKPEFLQAIRNSENNLRKDFLQYKSGDIVTVIDKNINISDSFLLDNINNSNRELYWKGVTNDRKTGFFDPSDFVAYLGQNLPSSNQHQSSSSTSFVQSLLSGSGSNGSNHHHSSSSIASTITSTVLQSSKFLRGLRVSKSHSRNNNNNHSNSNNCSPHGGRKNRLRPEMISRPQGDFKHTGHVGADGVFFGDISFLEGKYHDVNNSHDNNNVNNESKKSRKLTISGPIQNFNRNSVCSMNNNKTIYSNSNHEYHEISDDEDNNDDDNNNGPLESPPFEVDFGPSLLDEVFRELDHIKPDLNNEAADCETAINENSINVKNEVRELNLKISKDQAANLKKKQSSMVKSISEAEQNELDSAIAMAKDIANRTMMEDDLDLTKNNDSPKTPNSPNKKNKFSFKFPVAHHHHRSPKSERRTFSEETQSIGNIIESITPAAKEAYMSLVDKGVSGSGAPSATNQESDKNPPSPTDCSGAIYNVNLSPNSSLTNEIENNPLRMLRTAGIGKVLRPKVRGNRSFSQPRLPTTAQTAGLARVASSRSPSGLLPPVMSTNCEDQSSTIQTNQQPTMVNLANPNINNNNNALPLPPRDRSRPLIVQLKTHQRRHPLVIPPELSLSNTNNPNNMNNYNDGTYNSYSSSSLLTNKNIVDDVLHHHLNNNNSKQHDSPTMMHRHVPVLKQVSCPQAPAAFLSIYNNKTANNNNSNDNNSQNNLNNPSAFNSFESAKLNVSKNGTAPLQTKPNGSYLSDDLTESLENEIQKAFDNIKINSYSKDDDNEAAKVNETKSIINSNVVDSKPMQSVKPQINTQIIEINLDKRNGFSDISNNAIVKHSRQDSGTSSKSSNNSIIMENNNKNNLMTTSLILNPSTPSTSNTNTNPSQTTNSSKLRNIDSDEVRVMQKVLSNEVNLTAQECARILDTTDWDIHKAIKCIRLRQQLRSHNINVDDINWSQMLSKFNWNIRHASNYLIATQGVPEDTTEV